MPVCTMEEERAHCRMDMPITKLLAAPLSLSLAVFFLATGSYSLLVDIKNAQTQNHKRDEKAARIGGWINIALGVAILVKQVISG